MLRRWRSRCAVVALLLISAILVVVLGTFASVSAPQALLTITLDDGYTSAYTKAFAVAKKYGVPIVIYPITSQVGKTGRVTAAQLKEMDFAGCEIGSHTVTHPEMPTLTEAKIIQELTTSKTYLESLLGHPVTSLAWPFGAYNPLCLREAAKLYPVTRGFWDINTPDEPEVFPYNQVTKRVIQVQRGGKEGTATIASATPAQVLAHVNETVKTNGHLILVFHNLTDKADTRDPWSYTVANFEAILQNVKGVVPVVTLEQARASESPNLISNPQFDQGATDWFTRDPANVTFYTASGRQARGMVPTPNTAVRLRGKAGGDVHLFHSLKPVEFGKEYAGKCFLNLQKAGTGSEIGLIVDEYDANGIYLDFKWMGGTTVQTVREPYFIYRPSSNNVASIGLQVSCSGVSTDAYVDNFRLVEVKQ